MYLFGWGTQTAVLGTAGHKDCRTCQIRQPVEATLVYRYGHVFWLIGAIITRRYEFACQRCGTQFEARSSRLRKITKVGATHFISLGPLFVITLGGALLLIGPGDYSD